MYFLVIKSYVFLFKFIWIIVFFFKTDAFKPGLYEVIKKNGINSTVGPLKQSGKENCYPCKSILKIIEIKYIPTEWRIRGQIKGSLDWVSIIETKTYTPWMKFIVKNYKKK
jgi:hypothetical protein